MRLIFGILIGAILTAFIGYSVMMNKGGDMMFADRISPYSYEETVDKLKSLKITKLETYDEIINRIVCCKTCTTDNNEKN